MAEKQSLAAKSGALTERAQKLTLPSIFSAPAEPVKARRLPPYTVFAHPKRADEWNRIAAQCGPPQEGEFYLVHPDYIVHLPIAKLGWLCHRQYWAEGNAAGEILRTSWEERPKPYREFVEAVTLVYLDDRIVPANSQFRTTKCPAAKTLSDALLEAAKPEWGTKSPAHKESMVCGQPFMRFYGLMTLSAQRTSKETGLNYRTAQVAVEPTGVSEWRLLSKLSEAEDAQQLLNDAAQSFQYRLKQIETKLIRA